MYAEVENFKSAATERGFHTVLHGRYHVLDKAGNRAAEQDFATTEEYCRNERKDFFVRYYMNIPKTLAPGEYRLQLTIEDTQANKAGQAEIPFSVEWRRVESRSYSIAIRTVCTPSFTATSRIWGGFMRLITLISPLRSL